MISSRRQITANLTLVLAIGAVAAGQASAQAGPAEPAADPAAATQFTSSASALEPYPLAAYSAAGSSFAQSAHFGELGWNDAQVAAFLDGMRAAFQGRGNPADDSARQLIGEMGRHIAEIEAAGKSSRVAAPNGAEQLGQYMKAARHRLGLQLATSGLGYRVDGGRGGIRPRPGDTVVVTCIATAADGTTKLSQLSCQKYRIKMAGLLPGLMEGLQMMTVDSNAVFVLPPTLSFGDGSWPETVARGSPLIFSVTLHQVETGAIP